MTRTLAVLALACTGALVGAPTALARASHDFELRVLSSPATMVTGGDALVEVTVPRTVPMHKVTCG